MYLQFLWVDSVQYPVQVTVDPGVHPWHPLCPTQAGTKADDSYQVPFVSESVTGPVGESSHQSTAAVANTRVLIYNIINF